MRARIFLGLVVFLSGAPILSATPVAHVEQSRSGPEPRTFLLIGSGLVVVGLLGTRALRSYKADPRS